MSRRINFLLGFAATLVLSGCSGDGATAPAPETALTPAINTDVAIAAADGIGDDIGQMRELSAGLQWGIVLAANLPGLRAACPYDAATGFHTCPAVMLPNGFTVDRKYKFMTASGGPMEKYDPIETDAINIVRSTKGSINRTMDVGSVTGSVEHSRDMTVSGLAGNEQKRTWDGTGTSKISRTTVRTDKGTRSYSLNATVTIAKVVLPHFNNEDKDRWPISGTITKVMKGEVTLPDGSKRTIDRTVTVTFNGTQFAEVTVNGETHTIDLAERRVLRGGPPKP